MLEQLQQAKIPVVKTKINPDKVRAIFVIVVAIVLGRSLAAVKAGKQRDAHTERMASPFFRSKSSRCNDMKLRREKCRSAKVRNP